MAALISVMNKRYCRRDGLDKANRESHQLSILPLSKRSASLASDTTVNEKTPGSVGSDQAWTSTGCNTTVPHTCSLSTCERVTLNVSGEYYEIWAKILNRYPDTLLGNPEKRQMFYDKERDEYFLDRHRPTFEAIFHFYRYGGYLCRPENVPSDIFLLEAEFFEIDRTLIAGGSSALDNEAEKPVLPSHPLQRKIWLLMEYPETSCYAYAMTIISITITVLSIFLFCIETIPSLKKACDDNAKANFTEPFFLLESICSTFFTVELFLRFFSCPSKLAYFREFRNIVDITAVVPYYVTVANALSNPSCKSAKSSTSLAFIRVVRLMRVFKLTKHSAGLQVLLLTFRASVKGLLLFLVAIGVCILIYSSAIYFAELGVTGSQMTSIPDAFWWAIITMTSVGYGDQVPVGTLGKVVGSMCAISGVLTLAIPVPIITENFNRFYAQRICRSRM